MGDEDNQQKIPGTDDAAAGGAAPAAAAPAGAAPAAGTPAKPAAGNKPNAAAPAKPAAGKPGASGGGTEIRMSSKALRERIDRDAASKIRRALGCTLEEAQAKLKAASSPEAAVAAANAAAPGVRPRGADPEVEKLRRQLADKTARLEAQKAKNAKVKDRERDKRVSLELRYSAVAAGISDEHADFALDQLAQAVRKTPAGKDPTSPAAFWPALLKARPYLGKGAAAAPVEVPLDPTTAPPESRAPGEATPKPPAPGERPKEKGVDELSDEEFASRTEKRYKFRVPA